jgi:hypothetical protein
MVVKHVIFNCRLTTESDRINFITAFPKAESGASVTHRFSFTINLSATVTAIALQSTAYFRRLSGHLDHITSNRIRRLFSADQIL